MNFTAKGKPLQMQFAPRIVNHLKAELLSQVKCAEKSNELGSGKKYGASNMPSSKAKAIIPFTFHVAIVAIESL